MIHRARGRLSPTGLFALAAALIVAGGCMVAMSPAPAATPRNIIVLLTDDQRYDDLGCTGNRDLRTPHIDAISRDGLLFRNFFVTSSVCMASRASLFTGRAERSHACNFYYRRLAGDAWEQSYPVLLRRAGYRTGFVGKFGVDVEGFPKGLPAGAFDQFDGFAGQGSYFPEGRGGRHLTRIMGDQAIGFLRDCARVGRPFCLSVSFKAPHVPLEPDPAHAHLYADTVPERGGHVPDRELTGLPGAYRDAAWYARLEWLSHFSDPAARRDFILQRYRLIAGVDAEVGRILGELSRLGLDRDTAVFFSSDNGYYYGEHGLGTKFYLHEESIRVPLIVRCPWLDPRRAGVALDQLAANIDVAPTILDIAGLAPPPGMQGRSLLPLLQGEGVAWRDAIFCENIIKERRPMCDAIRTPDWKLITHFEHRPIQEELYRLSDDPRELRNLADDPACRETRDGLRVRLQQLRVHYSGVDSGFPEWIATQRENAANWQGYRAGYLKLLRERERENTQKTKGGTE